MKHAQGPVVKGDFNLTGDNIDEYERYAVNLDADLRWINSYIDIKYKLDHISELNDELYTESYLTGRLNKLKAQRDISRDEMVQKLVAAKAELSSINKEIDIVRPLVFHPEEGKKPEHHERMSDLDDRRKQTEDLIAEICADKYPLLKKNLLKIFYMIVEGCEIDTVRSCFRQMKLVLVHGLSTEEASAVLMQESIDRYNLPKGIWDPIKTHKKQTKR
jgi:hypothetical protein